jgi:hypothetical protein
MAEIGMVATFFLDHIHFWGDYHYTSVLHFFRNGA